jgi:hypoxanthine-DNA glycosylase
MDDFMGRIHCFEPIIDFKTEVLVIGTIPGVESLKQSTYYANKSNHFWDIVYRCFDSAWDPYEVVIKTDRERLYSFLLKNKVGLWDIIESCERKGSSDNKIVNPIYNDFKPLLSKYSKVKMLIFNGIAAKSFYKRSQNVNLKVPAVLKVLNSTSTLNPNNTFMILNEWKKALT